MSFLLLPKCAVHPTEELLEEYSFGRVSEPALARLEEHLLVCVPCQEKLEEVERCIAEIRAAARIWEREAPAKSHRVAFLHRRRAFLALATAAGMAGIALVADNTLWRPQARPPSTVKLLAMRGMESGAMVPVPAGRPLELTVDKANLLPEPGYRVQIVDPGGREVWNGTPAMAGTTLTARVSRGVRSGVYWVRLYSSSGKLLREFGMRAD